jgi:hypothetical protein
MVCQERLRSAAVAERCVLGAATSRLTKAGCFVQIRKVDAMAVLNVRRRMLLRRFVGLTAKCRNASQNAALKGRRVNILQITLFS